MKIGIIGVGNMGRALGLRWAKAGHHVLFGSRDANKARSVAASAGDSSLAGSFDDAAAHGEVALYTVRDVLPSRLLRDPRTLSGKTVVDCNNSAIIGLDVPNPDPASKKLRFPTPVPSLAERLAANVPDAAVVKAFNTLPATVIALDRDALVPHRVSVFLCSDDARAKSIVKGLAEELGFVGVDGGALERAQLVEAVADLVRAQILEHARGPLATISLQILSPARDSRAA